MDIDAPTLKGTAVVSDELRSVESSEIEGTTDKLSIEVWCHLQLVLQRQNMA
jgi:hypothetical protein